jgi:glycogen(starch) synthase
VQILFWTDGFWPRIGGIETQALQFVHALTQKGHQCLVVAQKKDPALQEEVYQGISIRRFDFDAIIPKKRLHELRLIESYLDRVIREFRPDVVHLNACMGWAAFIFSLFRSKFQVPVVLTVHAPYFYNDRVISLLTRICSLADQICCVSQWVFNEMEKQIVSSRGKLSCIYNGLALSKIAPAPLGFSPPTLLLLGRLAEEKGFDIAIHAFFRLKQNGSLAELLIVGGGEEEPFLRKRVREYALEESVRFLGPLSREEIPIWINRATLLCVPSFFESFGLAALEAMQLERPVIASRVGGLPEVILDGKTGLLIPEKDPEALFQAMRQLLAEPKRAIAMGKEGRQRAIDYFSLEQNVTAYEQIYAHLNG